MDIRFANPIHPGEMLREEFMKPLGLSAGKLAKALNVPRTRIERLAREETAMSLDTAVRLARYFRMSEGYWTRMQVNYELDCLHADKARQAVLEAIEPLPRPDLKGQAA